MLAPGLQALSQPPFDPLTSIDLKELSLKTTLFLALTSAKHIGDLHMFSGEQQVYLLQTR